MMKLSFVLTRLLLVCLMCSLASCDLLDMLGGPDDDPIGGGGGPDPTDIAGLRAEIFEIAEAAQGDCDGQDNSPAVRERISELIDQLALLTPTRTESEKLSDIVGGWQQIWSDTRFTSIPGVCFEAEDIYQVVYPDGFYYNISQVRFLGRTYTNYTRGEYEVGTDFLPIVFTNNFFARGGLEPGTNLVDLGLQAENGEIARAPFIPSIPLNGATGRLGNWYVDEELRVITDGRSARESNGIFVSRRVEVVQ